MKRERDPNNEWLYKISLSESELEEERKKSIEYIDKNFGQIINEFTCDKCKQASICGLVFDSYNTDGDCLYEK